jgi:PUA domain protein
MTAKHRRYFLKDKETKTLLSHLSEKLRLSLEQTFGSKISLEVVQTGSVELYLVNGEPVLARTDRDLFPTLDFKGFFALAPKAVVDMGAVPYVCKGANVMAPGIKRFEGDFKKGDIVLVVDEKHGKALAIGEVLYDSEEAKNVKQGIVIRNIHFVSDQVWGFMKQIAH